ncbi:DUF2076 domain-containing protein [Elioraea sp.]|uniref:DUF2076 domain-containing protein n=1 Tax=Elioraea sp. TaxID=2185103 RepID=UPI003F721F4E
MTDEERRLITDFVTRVIEAGGEAIDPEADALLGELFARHPAARYRVAQMAFFQEHALAEASNRIHQLEWQLERAQSTGGIFGGLFGNPQQRLPPPAAHAPGYRPGLFDQGRGFVGTAGTTALAVMGGFLVGGALASMMAGDAEAAEAAPTDDDAPDDDLDL